MAIELVLTLRLVFHLALRQVKGSHARSCACSAWICPCRIPPRSAVAAVLSRRDSRVPQSMTGPFMSCSTASAWRCLGRANGMPRSMAAQPSSGASYILAIDAQTGEIVAHVLTEGHG